MLRIDIAERDAASVIDVLEVFEQVAAAAAGADYAILHLFISGFHLLDGGSTFQRRQSGGYSGYSASGFEEVAAGKIVVGRHISSLAIRSICPDCIMWDMRVLVLGGTGLTGPFLVNRLHELGHEVTVFHRGRHEAQLAAGIRRVIGDLQHPPLEVQRASFDVVAHMWAMTEADAQSFLKLFRGRAGRAVVISSCDVYRPYGRLRRLEEGAPDPTSITEDSPLRESRYPHGDQVSDGDTEWMRRYDKILVEQALMGRRDFPLTILRYPAVYGTGDHYHRFRAWLNQMATGDEIRVQDSYARWRWTHSYVENAAEAAVLATIDHRAAGKVYNVGETETPTMEERIRELGRAAGWDGRVLAVPEEELPAEQHMPLDFAHDLVVDSSRIRRELGYTERVGRADGLARTVQWERQPPPAI
jgi:nucleoside-diphosphate-sugar epimerase